MRVVILGCAALALAGCATQVIRKDAAEVVDLSGRWNDTDARLVAEEMVRTCTAAQWVARFNKQKGRDPVVIVGTVTNRSHEHINANVFIEDLEMALVNSGRVRFVASKTGADFMLQGSINSVKDETRGQYAIMFQSNLELIDLTTNEKVWIGQKKVKKRVKRPQYSLP